MTEKRPGDKRMKEGSDRKAERKEIKHVGRMVDVDGDRVIEDNRARNETRCRKKDGSPEQKKKKRWAKARASGVLPYIIIIAKPLPLPPPPPTAMAFRPTPTPIPIPTFIAFMAILPSRAQMPPWVGRHS